MGKCSFLNHSIITHRGIYNNITIYENTLESYMYSINNNLSILVDVRETLDNKIICFFDKDASRLLKLRDDINTLTKEEIDYISSYNIPLLEDVLFKVNGKVPIIINVLDDSKVFRNMLVSILKKYSGEFTIQSDNLDCLKYYKKYKYVIGLVINRDNIKLLNRELDVDYLSIRYDMLDKVHANMLKRDYYLIGYGIDSRDEVLNNIRIYNNIIVDNVEEVFK